MKIIKEFRGYSAQRMEELRYTSAAMMKIEVTPDSQPIQITITCYMGKTGIVFGR